MVLVIGHRGAPALAPENTLRGIRVAFDCGADLVEVDVRLTSDGELILMHDETVDRTTGVSGKVEDLSYAEIRDLSAGGETIPALEEAVALTQSLGIGIVVEMKEEWIEELVLGAVAGSSAIITSFYHRSLLELRSLIDDPSQLLPPGKNHSFDDIRTGIIISSLPVNPVDLAISAKADAIFPKRVDANLVKNAHSRNIRVYPWTVNDPERAVWLIKLGADGLVTDDPYLIRVAASQPVKETGRGNCEYYPCHHFAGQDCTHCFCPLYPCRDPDLGRYVRTKRGKRIWSCIDCRLVHRSDVAAYLAENPQATTSDLKAVDTGISRPRR